MNKIKLFSIIAMLALIAFTYTMYFLIEKNAECINNPFVYGAQVSYDAGYPLDCRCSIDAVGNFNDFVFDEEGITTTTNQFRELQFIPT